ncbi:hypothetical protein FQN57_001291 [Myotisia sp. PD_48]|nr:hypothetical protein FQN57_001291 [Myotisia sp. PD_48]
MSEEQKRLGSGYDPTQSSVHRLLDPLNTLEKKLVGLLPGAQDVTPSSLGEEIPGPATSTTATRNKTTEPGTRETIPTSSFNIISPDAPSVPDGSNRNRNVDCNFLSNPGAQSYIRFQTEARPRNQRIGNFRTLATEQLEIVRWCIDNIELYRRSSRAHFYSHLQRHMSDTFHRDFKQPGRILGRMVRQRRRHRGERVIIGLDRELDKWIAMSGKPLDGPSTPGSDAEPSEIRTIKQEEK